MSHLLKRTKKSCIKFIRKLSNKQIFLKRLEEEDICGEEIDISQDGKEKDINQNENAISPQNSVTCYGKHKKLENKGKPTTKNTFQNTTEDDSKDSKNKRKLSIHFEEHSTENKAVLQSLTSKLFLTADGYEFQRLQQLRSDTASEIVPYEGEVATPDSTVAESPPLFADEGKIDVLFEKVKYKEDVRYLRHTPSTCSLDNYIINDGNQKANDDDDADDDYDDTNCNDDNLIMITTMRNTSNNGHQLFCLDNNKNFEYNTTTMNTTTTSTTSRGLEFHNNEQFVLNQEQDICQTATSTQPLQPYAQQLANTTLPLNVSLGCVADGNYHQFFIGEERDYFYKLTPIVKWDINGNSLEDNDFPEFGINGNCSPAKSSLRSSSTTLDTWLEVD